MAELYDLERDSYGLTNVAGAAGYAGVLRDVCAERRRLTADAFGLP
jgi:hypothetical protein